MVKGKKRETCWLLLSVMFSKEMTKSETEDGGCSRGHATLRPSFLLNNQYFLFFTILTFASFLLAIF